MPVEIKILGDLIEHGVGAEECAAALDLKKCFEDEFTNKSDVNGLIVIKPNFKAIGYNPEDIDLVVWMNFNNYTYNLFTGYQYIDSTDKQVKVEPYLEQGILIAEEMTAIDLEAIKTIEKSKPKLSQQDCSAYHQSRSKKGTLITSDNVLRKFALATNLDVHGHLWVLDQMVEQQTLVPLTASQKLTELCDNINTQLRLPKAECDQRREVWNN